MKIGLHMTTNDLIRWLSAIARDAAERPAAVRKPGQGPATARRGKDNSGAKRALR